MTLRLDLRQHFYLARMAETAKIVESFTRGIVNGVYDAIDLTLKAPMRACERAAELEMEYQSVLRRIEDTRRKLELSPPPAMEQPRAQMTSEHVYRAENAQRCLTMCSRMTTCQIDSQNRVTCGGVILKSGGTFDGLQANWDLVDTVTGADA